MQYTTVVKLRTYLGIQGTDQDSLLDLVIKRATAQFDKYLGRNLQKTTYTEYLSVDGDTLLVVDKWPIKEIKKLKQEDVNGADISYKRTDGNIIYLTGEVDGTVYVEYDWGFESLDDLGDVEQACLEVCKDLWDNTPASGNEANIKSKQIETLSKTYFSKDEMAGGISVTFRETLDNYKTFNPLIV